MNHQDREKIIRDFLEEKCFPVLQTKGKDYAPDDANENFKTVARHLDVSHFTVWSVYFMKHVLAIMTWIKSGTLQSESIESRIADAVNYLLILVTLIEDGRWKIERT